MASALETLCGQAYGAKQYHMLGIYMQRSWIVLLALAVLLAPIYVFSGQIMIALGMPAQLSREAGLISLYMLPSLFLYAILLPVNRFLQCQLKNWVTAVATAVVFPVHIVVTWLLVQYFELGVLGAAIAFNLSWTLFMVLQLAYALGGGCPETWTGFSASAFVDLKEFVMLSTSSGVMVCMSLSGWEMMIHLGFLAGTGVRVANELGAANGQGARFATFVSTTTSFLISLFISLLTLALHDKLALIFTSSEAVINAVDDISVLLALTILLNGVQPVLSGVAIGSGSQALGVWVGMIGGTTVQTLILALITLRCDWNEEV
ncbi:hypothetical protein PR202_ga15574 [Eleusine coracana subsp. coracana]|uniref:Uncharacterized protein n=1 Tax=Eleusine coracana subsp. coracana TaxID=191504 RepID=A0AAV5CK07_ELECO|nr:hypothetical protein PR202_ga15574 [Eleusine coracana subsp. coracana]